MITVEGVTKNYKAFTAVDDVSFDARSGRVTGNIAVTGVTWLLIPLAIGLGFVMRAEVE